jgi:hypothetical protein
MHMAGVTGSCERGGHEVSWPRTDALPTIAQGEDPMSSTQAFIPRRNALNGYARQFLRDLLRDGPQPYTAIRQRAREAGVRLSALWTAKRTLNVQSYTRDGYAVWHLPGAA